MRPALLLLVLSLVGCTGYQLAGIGEVRVRFGDDPAWASPDYDDSGWQVVDWSTVDRREVWWLRASVTIPQALRDSGAPLGFYLFAMASAEIYWDGELIGRNGRVGAVPADEAPGSIAYVVALPGDLAGPHTLAIRFSAHAAGARVRTPVDALLLGPYGSPLRFSRDLYLPALVVGGALVLALLLLTGLAIRGRDAAAAWLALATFGALAQLAAETVRAFVAYPYTLHSLRLGAIGAAAGLTGLGLLGFSFRRFVGDRAAWPWLAAYLAIVVGTLVLVDWGDEGAFLYLFLATAGGMATAGAAARRGVRSAWLALAAFLALGLLLFLNQTGFLDRSFYFGLTAFLLFFFVEHLRAFFRTRSEREAAELKAARLELELAKRHLQPHFLLNTLTTLDELIATDPERAGRLIDALGAEFRMLNELSRHPTVRLADEVALCRAHLDAMGLRYDASLGLDVASAGIDLATVSVPPVVLHTLIENALTHNRFDDESIRFRLRVGKTDAGYRLEFTAPRGEAVARQGSGLGGDYIRARLEEAFGDRARLTIEDRPDAWITRLEMPA